jgi:nuclear pore complex protein Nup133
MICEVSHFRMKQGQDFASNSKRPEPEFLAWTASEGPGGMRGLLTRQHALTVKNALPDVQDNTKRQQLLEQLVHLSDAILDGFRMQLDSVKQSGGHSVRYIELLRQYEGQRTLLLAPFGE